MKIASCVELKIETSETDGFQKMAYVEILAVPIRIGKF
jgi:hypothetical protein